VSGTTIERKVFTDANPATDYALAKKRAYNAAKRGPKKERLIITDPVAALDKLLKKPAN